VEVSVTRGTSPSHRLVSECAVLYNRLAAAFLVERGVEAVFRTQPEPDDELPDTVAGGPAAELAARRLLESSRMERTPGRHHMLGLDAYTMASSPIRRAFDLLMQWQISATLDEGGKDPLDAAGLDALLLRAGEAYGALGRIERNRKRYWLLRYLHTKVEGAIVTAVVVDRQSDRVLLHLPEYAMEVPVRTRDPEAFRTGEEREVRIDRADARRDLVRVSIVR